MADIPTFAPERQWMVHAVWEVSKARGAHGIAPQSGGSAAAQGSPNMTLAVSEMTSNYGTTAAGNVSFDAAHATYGRMDVLYQTAAGAFAVHKGTAMAIVDPLGNYNPATRANWQQLKAPYPADALPAGVPMYLVYIGPAVTSITNDDIYPIAALGITGGDHTTLLNIGTNTHAQIDTYLRGKPYVTVGPQAWCDYVVSGGNGIAQINAASVALNTLGGGEIVLTMADVADMTLGAGSILLKKHTSLRGVTSPNWCSWRGGFNDALAQSSMLAFTSTTAGDYGIICEGDNEISNLAIYYPNQEINATPTAYPATIHLLEYADDVTIRNVCAINPYIFVNAVTDHNRLHVVDCVGFPLLAGIIEDLCSDISILDNVHFNPNYGIEIGATLLAWVKANGTAFNITQSDGGISKTCHCYSYKYGWYVNGAVNYHILNCCPDECGTSGIHVAAGPECIIDDCTIYSDGFGVVAAGASGMTVSNNRINAGSVAVSVSAPDSQIIGNKITNIGNSGYGISLSAAATSGIVSDNHVNCQGRTSGTGISFYETDGFSCVGNVVKNATYAGIAIVVGAIDFIVVGNVCKTCGTAFVDGSGAVNKDVAHWGVVQA